MKEFAAFSLTHALVVVTSVITWVLVVRGLRRVRGTSGEGVWRRRLAWTVLVPNTVFALWLFLPSRWDLSVSLPADLCDLAWIVAGVAILTANRRWEDLIYYWGFGLSTQAFVTPTLEDGPATISFWDFWIKHWCIVGVPVFLVGALGYRPTWDGLRRSIVLSLIPFTLVTVMNVVLDTNYFFTGNRTPDNPTVVDLLGPWPWRILILVAIVIALFTAMTAPFVRRARPATSPGPGR